MAKRSAIFLLAGSCMALALSCAAPTNTSGTTGTSNTADPTNNCTKQATSYTGRAPTWKAPNVCYLTKTSDCYTMISKSAAIGAIATGCTKTSSTTTTCKNIGYMIDATNVRAYRDATSCNSSQGYCAFGQMTCNGNVCTSSASGITATWNCQ